MVMPFVIVLGVVAAAIMIGSAAHQRKLLKHGGVTKDDFVQALTKSGASADVAAAVYDYYKRESTTASFQVSPDFSLRTVFRKSHEDVDEDVREILNGLGFHLPSESVLRQWPNSLESVRDVVKWISWVKERQASNPSPL
jgi:hypothetical protein